MFDLLIRNGKIVTKDSVFHGHIGIKNEKICAIFHGEIDENAEEVIDVGGKYIFPGAIDCHAHLNDPGYTWREDYEHGSEAAAVGGITTIIDMPLQNKPALTDGRIFNDKEKAVKNKSIVDYAFLGGLVHANKENIKELHKEGVVGFKSFIGPVSTDYRSLNIGEARYVLNIMKELNCVTGFHCEDYSIIKFEEERALTEGRVSRKDYLNARPLEAELIATKNIIDLCRETKSKVHICHVSHPDVAEEIKKAKEEGLNITAETCPHYLVFTEDDFLEKGTLFKCAPPLRSKDAKEKLWNYVVDGTLDCIGSDHSPAEKGEKCEEELGVFGAWGGISGLQSLLMVMISEGINNRRLSPTIIARILSYNPAKIFNLEKKKGAIECGYDADFTIVDLDKEWEITADSLKYKNKISAFTGLKGKGAPICTIVRGKIVSENEHITIHHGYGNLIKK
ncbi:MULTISPECIES: allantoinase AllB [Clostridium]|uniref:allantoinase AllB n=1 Tax=Clostridium TaxID=1485 RepID=UPI0002D20920|nr:MULTISPECIES: allantoinase AllB [Clostridium]ENZ32759.1 allantoinase [Clostridium butyricum 60E.3]MBS4842689.1 allantoinase AllB [Clostridium sp.]MDU1116695.1 allantoinase AllB [Clostridium sp.]MDU1403544.1 allantoinase AllB [Clostridium sp.]MDU1604776.1 allantoinase AllB [Clostridium sp.]